MLRSDHIFIAIQILRKGDKCKCQCVDLDMEILPRERLSQKISTKMSH